jgi:hypothetical protein
MSEKIKVNQTITLTIHGVEHILTIDEAREVFESLREIVKTSPKTQPADKDIFWKRLKELEKKQQDQSTIPYIPQPWYDPENIPKLPQIWCTVTHESK